KSKLQISTVYRVSGSKPEIVALAWAPPTVLSETNQKSRHMLASLENMPALRSRSCPLPVVERTSVRTPSPPEIVLGSSFVPVTRTQPAARGEAPTLSVMSNCTMPAAEADKAEARNG